MEVNARVSKELNQVRIQKRGRNFTELMTIKDAKAAWEGGRITSCNLAFRRLANLDFDTKKLLAFYKDERDRLKREKDAATGDKASEQSLTDES